MSEDGGSATIEFNSMVAVLKRLDKITNFINLNRSRGNWKVMHGFLTDYFKEIVADLTKPEMDEAWKELTDVKKYLNYNSNLPINGKVPQKLDEIDIKLRLLAKTHGYLTANKMNVRKKLIS